MQSMSDKLVTNDDHDIIHVVILNLSVCVHVHIVLLILSLTAFGKST